MPSSNVQPVRALCQFIMLTGGERRSFTRGVKRQLRHSRQRLKRPKTGHFKITICDLFDGGGG